MIKRAENARELALFTLEKMEKDASYSNLAFKEQAARSSLPKVEIALAANIVYGVTAHRITIDAVLKPFLKGKTAPVVMRILRCGVYQILYLDRVPNSAACNESVKLAGKYAKSAKGFVNAVLRNVIRSGGSIEYPKERNRYLSVQYSYPVWLVDFWLEQYGDEFCEQLLKGMNCGVPVTLLANTLKGSKGELIEQLKKEGVGVEEYGSLLSVGAFDIEHSESFRKGLFQVIGIPSVSAVSMSGVKPGDRVLDLCAAPGGKTSAAAIMMQDRGEIVSCDLHEHRRRLIENNCARLGLSCVKTKTMDGTVFVKEFAEQFDVVLLDVPCSGLGVINKKPDLKYSRPDFEALYDVQGKLLANAVQYVKPGGTLLYSTCTLNRAENEDRADTALRFGFTIVQRKTFFPHIDGTEGFFVCQMKKGICNGAENSG